MRKSEWIELRGNVLWTGGVRISEVDPLGLNINEERTRIRAFLIFFRTKMRAMVIRRQGCHPG